MGHSKLSVTIPDDIYDEIYEIASKAQIKLSHLVTEALTEMIRKKKAVDYIQQVNDVFTNSGVKEEQRRMADLIADNTSVDELPW
jgi:metal-responsive CopG/Arc/MetJ family transcriptional regulator